ncbi:MAG: hypothetical protein TREMPRED_005896 [Tremellales sp. Tagirdzhanova-0007]|nr:MAG: hypothetical protein TREMPRED_005896 [Tremellales sp. Tagirdzhanova-0007]
MAPSSCLLPIHLPSTPSPRSVPPRHPSPSYIDTPKSSSLSLHHRARSYTWIFGLVFCCLTAITCLILSPSGTASLADLSPITWLEQPIFDPVMVRDLSTEAPLQPNQKARRLGDESVISARQDDLPGPASALVASPPSMPPSSPKSPPTQEIRTEDVHTTPSSGTMSPSPSYPTKSKANFTSTAVFADPSQARNPSAERPDSSDDVYQAAKEKPVRIDSRANPASGNDNV